MFTKRFLIRLLAALVVISIVVLGVLWLIAPALIPDP